MNTKDAVEQMKTMRVVALDPDSALDIYAHILSLLESRITEADLQRLLLMGAVMHKNSTEQNLENIRLSLGFMDSPPEAPESPPTYH